MRRKVLELKRGFIKIKEENEKKTRKGRTDFTERRTFFLPLADSLGIAFSLSLPLVFGAILGSYLDRVFSTHPKLTLSFIFLGVMISGATLFRLVSSQKRLNLFKVQPQKREK